MKTLAVARKVLVELLREPKLLGMVLVAPCVILAIFAVAYRVPTAPTHPILVVRRAQQAEAVVSALAAHRYVDGRPGFEVTEVDDPAAAEDPLKRQEAAALVVIDEPRERDERGGAQLSIAIRGDPTNMNLLAASTLIETIARDVADGLAGHVEVIGVREISILGGGPQTAYDVYAPGVMLLAILLLIPHTAMLIGREVRWRTLRRLQMTRLRARDFLGGIALSQLAFGSLFAMLTLAAAVAFGFEVRGSLALAALVAVFLTFSAIGLGLVVGCFASSDGQATNIGSAVMMVQVLLAGAFFPLPPVGLFRLAGHEIGVYDVFPATHGLLAWQQVLTYGVGFDAVQFRLAATLLLSLAYFVVGIVIFQRVQMTERA